LGGFEVSEKATNLITGILADNAGWQSITAGDMSGTAKSVVGKGERFAGFVGGKAFKTAGGAGLSALGFGAKMGLKGAAGVGLGLGYGAYYGGKTAGKAVYSGGKALASKISAWRNSGNADSVPESHSAPVPEGQSTPNPVQTTTGFESFDSAPVGQQSPRIAAMAAAFDARNQGKSPEIAAKAAALDVQNAGKSSPMVQQSSKIAAMANAFNEHNLNPGQQTTDPYAAGQAAQTQKPVKQPPKSLRNEQNNS
jgi:hypothetical protein